MNRYVSFSFLFLITAFAVSPAFAQDEQEGDNSMLPDIDPQDIEIRSEFQARFPGLNRQPILGFEPSSRVYQIDPDRMPYMETEDQIVANLPVSELTRPDPPRYSPLGYSKPINALARAGMGSYVSPEVQFWGVNRLNRKSYAGGDLDFTSSNGHLDSQESSYRFFEANGEYATKLGDDNRLDIDGGLESSFNRMFNLGPAANIPDDSRKQYRGFHVGGVFERFQNRITGWNVAGNARYFNTNMDAGEASGESDEWVYNASVAKRWAGANVNETIALKAGVRGGQYENEQDFTGNWATAQAGVVYERLFNYTTKVTADASLYYGSDAFDDQMYIGPSLTIEHPMREVITLSAVIEAEPYVRTAEQLHSRNRFLNTNNQLQHSYRINGRAEAAFDLQNVGSLTMGVQYENITDYPMYVRDMAGSLIERERFYTTEYTDIYRIKAYAGASHQILADRFWVEGRAYVQTPQIQNGGRIPYEERFGVNASLGFRPIDQITVKAWTEYTGSRERMESDEEIGGYLLLGGRLDLYITDRIGAYVKMNNLLNQDYQIWPGYIERPFQAYGGVTVKF